MRGVLADLLKGIGSGVALALVFLLIGVARAAVVLLSGHPLRPLSASDVRLIVCYIGAFAFTGAWSAWRGPTR
jgi:hypothetical protein